MASAVLAAYSVRAILSSAWVPASMCDSNDLKRAKNSRAAAESSPGPNETADDDAFSFMEESRARFTFETCT